MPWGRLDDKFYSHPKILAVGLAPAGLYSIGLSYSAAQLTDGHIPVSAVTNFTGWKSAARRLVEGHLWEVAEGGWRVHDYLDWNPSREQVLGERQAAAVRKRASKQQPESGRIPATPEGARTPVSTPLHATPDVPNGTPWTPPNPPRPRGARNGHGLSDRDREELRLAQSRAIPLEVLP
jgi:hypothetical protein